MHSNVFLDLLAGVLGGALLFGIALLVMVAGRALGA